MRMLDAATIDKIRDGSHFMSPVEVQYFKDRLDANDNHIALTYLRGVWDSKVDREFIQSFYLIHWASEIRLDYLLSELSNSTELSVHAFRDVSYKSDWFWGLGVELQGHVTLAGNEDLGTLEWRDITKIDGKKYTDSAYSLFINEKTCKSPDEFTVGDWRPIRLVFDYDKISRQYSTPAEEQLESLLKLSKKYQLPVFNGNGIEYTP